MSPLTLSAKAKLLLEDLPPYESQDPRVQQVINSLALELQRVEDRAADVINRLFPQNADDTYRTLGMWERLLGLPVEPAGVTLATRQAVVLANVRMRQAGSGADWVALLTTALNTNLWTHQEGPADYTITMRIPYSSGGYNAGQAAQIARRVTPAHLQINSGLTGGFLIGLSLIGDVL